MNKTWTSVKRRRILTAAVFTKGAKFRRHRTYMDVPLRKGDFYFVLSQGLFEAQV